MIASEKASLSLACSVTGGVLNMALDYVLIAGLDMGIGGAAHGGAFLSADRTAGLRIRPPGYPGSRPGGNGEPDMHDCIAFYRI